LHARSKTDGNGDGGGVAKEKVGEYLGNLQSPFAMKVLSCFVKEFDFTGKNFYELKSIFAKSRNYRKETLIYQIQLQFIIFRPTN